MRTLVRIGIIINTKFQNQPIKIIKGIGYIQINLLWLVIVWYK